MSAISTQDLKALSRPSDVLGLLHLGGHALLLLGTGAVVWGSRGEPWLPLAMLLHGVVLVFLFAPLHESIHRTAFASRWLNSATGYACGLILLLPPNYFRAFHLAHHRFTQDPAQDPELIEPKPATLVSWLVHVSGLPNWISNGKLLLRHAGGRVTESFIAPRSRRAIVVEARIYLAIYATGIALSLAFASPALVLLWLGPVLLGQPFLRLYLLAEHTGCPETPDMLTNTRTTITNPFVRWLAWNMPFHVEHHAYPGLPFHALPEAHRRIRGRIVHLGRGYFSVNRTILSEISRRYTPAL
jgi:fatty acid desaturase